MNLLSNDENYVKNTRKGWKMFFSAQFSSIPWVCHCFYFFSRSVDSENKHFIFKLDVLFFLKGEKGCDVSHSGFLFAVSRMWNSFPSSNYRLYLFCSSSAKLRIIRKRINVYARPIRRSPPPVIRERVAWARHQSPLRIWLLPSRRTCRNTIRGAKPRHCNRWRPQCWPKHRATLPDFRELGAPARVTTNGGRIRRPSSTRGVAESWAFRCPSATRPAAVAARMDPFTATRAAAARLRRTADWARLEPQPPAPATTRCPTRRRRMRTAARTRWLCRGCARASSRRRSSWSGCRSRRLRRQRARRSRPLPANSTVGRRKCRRRRGLRRRRTPVAAALRPPPRPPVASLSPAALVASSWKRSRISSPRWTRSRKTHP